MLKLPYHFVEKIVSQLRLLGPFIHSQQRQMHLFGVTILQCSLKYFLNSLLKK